MADGWQNDDTPRGTAGGMLGMGGWGMVATVGGGIGMRVSGLMAAGGTEVHFT